MKTGLLATLAILLEVTGLCQRLTLPAGTPFHAKHLDIRWEAATNGIPPKVWVYHLLPRRLPASAMPGLMALGPFSSADLVRSNANKVLYRKADAVTSLWVSSELGVVGFQKRNPFGPTNLAHNIPTMAQLPRLTTNFLRELGISVSEVEKKPDGTPNLKCWEPVTVYYVEDRFITNVEYRAVGLRRAVDGASWVGSGTGGECSLQFGENGRPYNVWISWRNLERFKAYPTASPETIIRWVRAGKAVQNMIPMDTEPINWRSVKRVTVVEAKVCYYAGNQEKPSDWLMPFVALWTKVERGQETIELEIDAPIMDETRSVESK